MAPPKNHEAWALQAPTWSDSCFLSDLTHHCPPHSLCLSPTGFLGSQANPKRARRIPLDLKAHEFSSLVQCSAFRPRTCSRQASPAPLGAGTPYPRLCQVTLPPGALGHGSSARWNHSGGSTLWNQDGGSADDLSHLWGHSSLLLKRGERLQSCCAVLRDPRNPTAFLHFIFRFSLPGLGSVSAGIIPSLPGFFWGSGLNLWFIPIIISLTKSECFSHTLSVLFRTCFLTSFNMDRMRIFQIFKFCFLFA